MAQSSKRVLFLDMIGGNYLSQALILAPQFAKMYYHIPDYTPFKGPYNASIGTGYEQIEVLLSIWDQLEKFDLVIIPDIGLADYATHLKGLGKAVWGGSLDYLENNRDQFYAIQERLDMNTVDFEVVKGFKNLRKMMTQKKYAGWFCKINLYRNVFETFKYENPNHSEPILDKIQKELGPLDDMIFVMQAPIDGDVIEIGYDGFCINGQLPSYGLFGAEAKDAGFLCKFTSIDNMPKQIRQVNEQFSTALKAFKGSNFLSTEVRVDLDSGKGYYIDICARAGQPPSNLYLQMFSNWGSIIENGTQGILVEPEYTKKYGVEIILKSTWVNNNFLTVSFPEEYKDNIKLKGSFVRDGQTYVVPFRTATNYDLDAFGSVTVIGNDVQEIMKQALEIAQSIEGYDITYSKSVLEDLNDEIANLENKTSFKM